MQRRNLEIFLVSLAMLFLEIMLIRWVSTESRIFAYLNNLVLLACFLGIGVGCLISKEKADVSHTFLMLAVLILLLNLPVYLPVNGQKVHLFRDIPLLLSKFTDQSLWYVPKYGNSILFNSVTGMAATFIMFFVTAVTFFPLGQMLGRSLGGSSNAILAYSINIAGSLLGLWLFTGLSFMNTPPWLWLAAFIVIGILLLIVIKDRAVKTWLALAGLTIIAALLFLRASASTDIVIWSPYQKLEVDCAPGARGGYVIKANGVVYMSAQNLSSGFLKKKYDASVYESSKFSHYNIPYLFKPNPEEVLILGAGAGNDAAGAIRNDAGSVDVVEIDPVIYQIGLFMHPERPYQDPRIQVFIDDARSYLKKANKKYDLISFGLLDSHTSSSSYNNIRIDNYVYTEESFREAKSLMKKNGVLTVVFQPNQIWIASRIYKILDKVFESPPLYFNTNSNSILGYGGTMFVVGDQDTINAVLRDNFKNSNFFQVATTKTKRFFKEPLKISTDNWPYLYLKEPGIPKMHLIVMIVIFALSVILYRKFLFARHSVSYHFFFLGAAFTLLEFTNISKGALLFGSTWQVNTIVISVMLLLALFANLVINRTGANNTKPIYFALILSVLTAFFLPLSLFNNIPNTEKIFIASAVLNLPVFFAGMIFAISFKNAASRDRAFGSNIFGAAAGGLLESFSFAFGINMILLMVGGLYCLSLVFSKDA